MPETASSEQFWNGQPGHALLTTAAGSNPVWALEGRQGR